MTHRNVDNTTTYYVKPQMRFPTFNSVLWVQPVEHTGLKSTGFRMLLGQCCANWREFALCAERLSARNRKNHSKFRCCPSLYSFGRPHRNKLQHKNIGTLEIVEVHESQRSVTDTELLHDNRRRNPESTEPRNMNARVGCTCAL